MSTMSDSSGSDSWDEEEAQAKITEMTKKFLTSDDGIQFVENQVATRVADHIQGDQPFFEALLKPMISQALDSNEFKTKLSQMVQESLKTIAAPDVATTPAKTASSSTPDASSHSSTKTKSLKYILRSASSTNRKRLAAEGSTPPPFSKKTATDRVDLVVHSDDDAGSTVLEGDNSDSELERVSSQDDKKKAASKMLVTPDRYKHWEPVFAELRDAQKFKVGDFTTVRKEPEAILHEVNKHFTKVVATWFKTAIRCVEFPDGQKRFSTKQLDEPERLFVRTRLLHRAVIRKRASLRFRVALNTIAGYKARVDPSDTIWHAFADEVIADLTKKGKKTGELA